MKNKNKFVLIDGQGLIYRAFFALPQLSNSNGRIVNAIYGFTLMLVKILEQEKPDYIMVALDMPAPTFRHIKYKEYKANRKKMPKELIEQIPLIKEVIRNYNISIIEKEGYEADDIIGTVAKNAESKNYETLIITGDRDAFQLISSNTKVMMTVKGITETKLINMEDIEKKYGVVPEKIIDILALKGDVSDNIPGAPGIGEKTAISLIKEHGSLDAILEKPEIVSRIFLRNTIKDHKEIIKMSKELVTINRDVPLKYDFGLFKIKAPNYTELWTMFKKLEFDNLLKKISPFINQKRNKIEFHLIDNEDKLNEFIDILQKESHFSYYLVKSSEKILVSNILALAISLKNNENYYIPLYPINLIEANSYLPTEIVFSKLGSFFENKNIVKIGYNTKNDYILFKKNKIILKGNNHDIMISAYLLNPSGNKYTLEDVSWEYLKCFKNEDKTNRIKEIEDACQNASNIYKLKNILEEKLKEKKMFSLFEKIEIPLTEILGNMEIHGIKIDVCVLEEMAGKLNVRLKSLKQVIYHLADTEFNINSPKQLSVVLFEKLKLPVIKKTKTGYSTNSDVLNSLSSKHEIISNVLEYRELEKLKNTYVDKLPLLVDKKTSRIHTSFHQTITATGRLSSSAPNLQNIPVKTEIGREIRKAFVAEKEFVLLSADYSQIELRILAHLSRDERLCMAFEKNEDIHTHTASAVFGVEQNLVSHEMRRMAKIINFGIIYGMSGYGLARNLGISRIDAEKFIIQYFSVYYGVKEYIESKKEEARKNGYVITLLNRRRYVPEINSKNKNIREFNERVAVNTPIQGTAADLIKVAMISIEQAFTKNIFQSKMLLQIHDELIFEVQKKELSEIKLIVKNIMENSLKLTIPLKINLKTGSNWAELT